MAEMLGVAEVAQRYGVSGATVRRWCRDRVLPNAQRVGARTWGIPAKDLEGFIPPKPGPKPKQ